MPIDAANPVPPTYPRRAGMDQVPAHVSPDLIRSVGITYGPEFLENPQQFFIDNSSASESLFAVSTSSRMALMYCS